MTGNKWVTFAIILFIAYAIMNDKQARTKVQETVKSAGNTISSGVRDAMSSNNTEATPGQATQSGPQVSAIPADQGSFIQKQIAKMINGALSTQEGQEAIKKLVHTLPEAKNMVPKVLQEMSVRDQATGEGTPVRCGEQVAINYVATTMDGKLIEEKQDKQMPLQFVLGDGKVMRGLELAVIGMRKGGVRDIVMSPALTQVDPKFGNKSIVPDGYVKFNIELLQASELPKDQAKLRIFTGKQGEGSPAICGDQVAVNYTIADTSGNIIFDSAASFKRPINVTIGSENTPYGITEALEYSTPGEEKTVLLPPDLINNGLSQNTHGFFPDNLVLPKNELVIIELKRM